MKRYIISFTLAAVALLSLFLILAAVTAVPQSSQAAVLPLAAIEGCELIEPVVEGGYLVFKCVTAVPEPTVTHTHTATAVPTSTIEATPTIEPTYTAVPPTSTPEGNVQPYQGAPLCAVHDDRAFHTLWNEDAGCHYNHFHGDDPHLLDDLFGTAVYTHFGANDPDGFAEISYPWQTSSAMGSENEVKHGTYIWYVRRDLPCFSQFGTGCVTDFRALAHTDGTVHGAVVANHSFYLEARICDEANPTDCGIYRGGGWQGPARLVIDGVEVLAPPGSNEQRVFLHNYNEGNRCCGTWYNGLQIGTSGVVAEFGDMWDTVPLGNTPEEIIAASEWRCATDPDGNVIYEGCRNNASRLQIHIVAVNTPFQLIATLDPDGDGRANYEGYTDKRGSIVTGCTEPGLDCVPSSWDNIKTGLQYQYRGGYREYDICFNGTGAVVNCTNSNTPSGWIEYPIHLMP